MRRYRARGLSLLTVAARPTVHGTLGAAALLLVVLLLLGPSSYYGFLVTVSLLYGIAALGLNIPAGMLGQLSLGQGGMFAIGAYFGTTVAVDHGWPLIAVLPVTVLFGLLVGALLGLPAARLGSLGIGMVSLGFTFVVLDAADSLQSITGGASGRLGIVVPLIPGRKALDATGLFVVIAVVGWLSYLFHWGFRTSRFGRDSLALRGNELGAAALGVSPIFIKMLGVSIGSAMGALAGCLYAFENAFVSPDAFGVSLSILLLLMVLLGGPGTRLGPIVGAVVFSVVPIALASYPGVDAYVYGAALILVVRVLPRGIIARTGARLPAARIAAAAAGAETGKSAGASEGRVADPPTEPVPPERTAVLELHNVTRIFDGIRAVDGISFEAAAGEIVALVGPNGSGKTTVLNLISGYYPLSGGSILLNGNVLRGSPYRVARRGVGRTFQVPKVFPDLTVAEHLALAQDHAVAANRQSTHLAYELVHSTGLSRHLTHEVRVLGHGERRFLEITLSLVRSPSILLLDEPAAGLAAAETDSLVGMLRQLASEGLAIVLVEHHLPLVRSIANRIGVMNLGALIWIGPSNEMDQRAEVREAYLGPTVGTAV